MGPGLIVVATMGGKYLCNAIGTVDGNVFLENALKLDPMDEGCGMPLALYIAEGLRDKLETIRLSEGTQYTERDLSEDEQIEYDRLLAVLARVQQNSQKILIADQFKAEAGGRRR